MSQFATLPLAMTPSDALAMSMVALLSFALGMILTILIVMARSGSKQPHYEEELLDDGEESHNVGAGEQPTDTAEPWEKDPDWWKK